MAVLFDREAVMEELLASKPNPSLSEIYSHQCRALQVQEDPNVKRIFEQTTPGGITSLDLASFVFSPAAFNAVMEVSRMLPNLASLNLANTNLKPESVQSLVEMAAQHPSLTSISLANNNSLGFAAAKLLLPLIKENKRFIELDVEGTTMAAPTKELIRKVLLSNQTYVQNQVKETRGRTPTSEADDDEGLVVTDIADQSWPSHAATTAESRSDSFAAVVPVSDEIMPVTKADAPDPARMNVLDVKARNHELKSALMEQEERLNQYHIDLLNKCDGKQREIKRRQNVGQHMMQQFRDGWKWPLKSDFNVATCVAEFALNLSEEELESYYKHYTPQARPVHIAVKSLLSELLDVSTSRRRRNTLLEDLLAKAKNHGPGMHLLTELIGKFTELLQSDGTSPENWRLMLQETDQQIADLKLKIERIEGQRQDALTEEDLQAAETFFEVSLDTQEALIDVYIFRLNTLLDKGTRNRLLENLRQLCEQADTQMNETKHINDDLMGKIDADLKQIQQKVFEEQEGMKYREQEFLDIQQRMGEELMNNQRQQEKVWRDITYSFKELQELSEGRFKECENWMKEVEKHERRKVEYNAVLQVCEDHSRTLTEMLHDCNACEQLLRNFDEFIRGATKTITALADSTTAQCDDWALEDQKTYLVVFREFYMRLGEFLFKKQKRLEEVDRMIRNCEFQIDFCKETLDPDLHKYREQLKELQVRRVDVSERVQRMQVRGDDRAAQFMPHEDALRAAEYEFDSPLLEMHEDIVDRRARVLGQRQKFIDKDKEELVDKEAEGIEHLVVTTKQARKTGVSSLVHPLSPGKGKKKESSASTIVPPQEIIPNTGSPQAPVK